MATGMTAKIVWDGRSSVWGGMIVVNKYGDILSQHMHNPNDFKNYLYNTNWN